MKAYLIESVFLRYLDRVLDNCSVFYATTLFYIIQTFNDSLFIIAVCEPPQLVFQSPISTAMSFLAKNAFHHYTDVVSLARMDSIHKCKLYHDNRKDILLSIQAISLPLIS